MRLHSSRHATVFRLRRAYSCGRRAASASFIIALSLAALDSARAQDAATGNAITLPDVTVQQAPVQNAQAKPAEKQTKAKAKSKTVANKPSKPPEAVPAVSASADRQHIDGVDGRPRCFTSSRESGRAVVGCRCGTRRFECRCANSDSDRHEAICRDARVLRRGYSSRESRRFDEARQRSARPRHFDSRLECPQRLRHSQYRYSGRRFSGHAARRAIAQRPGRPARL